MGEEEKKRNIEFIKRDYSFEIRTEEDEESDKGVIVGRPIVYDSKTDMCLFEETIDRGALDKTDLKDVRFLVNHDISKIPLARSRNNNKNSTMQLNVDDKGLNIKVKLDIENNTEAKNLYSAVKRGDISGMSFMFGVDGEEWENLDSDYPTRHIKSISEVIEVSAVTFPAYNSTTIDARGKALDSAKEALDNARASKLLDSNNKNTNKDKTLELEKLKLETNLLLGGN